MQGGYIKLHRKLLEWKWYDDDTVFRLFIHILLKANYRTVKWHDITIERGQLLTSTVKLSEELHRSRPTIKAALNRLVEDGTISVVTTNKYTLITVNKFEDYQSESEQNRTASPTSNFTTNHTAEPTSNFTAQSRSTKGIAGNSQQQTLHQTLQQPLHQTYIKLYTSKESKEVKERKEGKEVVSTDAAAPTTTEQNLIDKYGSEATARYKKRFEAWAKKKNAKVDCIATIALWMEKDGVPVKTAEAQSSFDITAINDDILAQYFD